MNYYIAVVTLFLTVAGSPVISEEVTQEVTEKAAAPLTFHQQVVRFSQLGYRDKKAAIPDLQKAGAEHSIPLLTMLLNGELYVSKSAEDRFYRVFRHPDKGNLVLALTADNLAAGDVVDIKKPLLKKVRVNNSLRRALRAAIARGTLRYGSPEQRLSALGEMLGKVDPETANFIGELSKDEQSPDLVEMMNVVLSVFHLSHGDKAQRMAALAMLEGRLEPEVRGALGNALEANPEDKELTKAITKIIVSNDQKVEFYGFLEKFFFGLSLGSVFLLAAIGLAITFGVMGVINMAHGEMIMLGAYTTYVVQLLMPNHLEYSLFVAIPAAFVVSGLFGIAIERGVIRFLHGRPLETLLATFGISLVLQQLVRTVFSPLNRQVASPKWMSGSVDINPVLSLTMNRLYILAFSLLVFGVLMYVFKYSNLGLNVRAVSQNRDMAKAMGVKTQWVDAMTFGLGSGVAGVAGVALSQLTNVGPNLGQSYIIDSFMVVVFGGVGNLLGTLVGAFSLGIANKFMEPATGAVLANILVLVFIILFIQKRPKGLFPQRGRAAE